MKATVSCSCSCARARARVCLCACLPACAACAACLRALRALRACVRCVRCVRARLRACVCALALRSPASSVWVHPDNYDCIHCPHFLCFTIEITAHFELARMPLVAASATNSVHSTNISSLPPLFVPTVRVRLQDRARIRRRHRLWQNWENPTTCHLWHTCSHLFKPTACWKADHAKHDAFEATVFRERARESVSERVSK